ncbi:MAG: hypothetical protein ACK42K_05485, partial [Leptonema sp. (in: bacteria)]
VGWVHTRTLELLLTEEGSGAIIIGCPQCSYREGTNWLEERLFKDREPFLRKDKVNPNKIKIIYPTTKKEFIKEIEKFKQEIKEHKISHLIYNYVDKKNLLFASIITILILSLLIIFLSDLNYKTPFNGQPQLIVSFKHPGQVSEQCIELSPEELAKLPVHMRNQKKCQRKRSPVRMAIYIDDNKIIEKSYKPGGIW